MLTVYKYRLPLRFNFLSIIIQIVQYRIIVYMEQQPSQLTVNDNLKIQ